MHAQTRLQASCNERPSIYVVACTPHRQDSSKRPPVLVKRGGGEVQPRLSEGGTNRGYPKGEVMGRQGVVLTEALKRPHPWGIVCTTTARRWVDHIQTSAPSRSHGASSWHESMGLGREGLGVQSHRTVVKTACPSIEAC